MESYVSSAGVVHEVGSFSDDKPLIILTGDGTRKSGRPTDKGFQYNPMWLRANAFVDVVKESRREASTIGGELHEKLSLCGMQIMRWNKSCFENVQRRIKEIKTSWDRCNNRKGMSK